MSRRISRLRTEPPDRQPVLVVGALVVGLLVGLVTVPRMFSGMDTRAENYVVLASTLYQQGESPALLRDRLASVGIAQPASTVLTLAQRYASSRDKKQQNQAEMLDAFGKVLLNPDLPVTAAAGSVAAPTASVAPPVPPAGTPLPAGTVTTLSTPIGARPTQTTAPGAPSPAPAGQPVAPPPAGTPAAGAPAPNSAPAAALSPTGASAPAPAPAGTPGAIQRGKVKPPDGGSARLRAQPSTDGGALSLIPNAAQVEILESVRGQSYEGETRWLRVRYGNLTGYVSSKLVVVGE